MERVTGPMDVADADPHALMAEMVERTKRLDRILTRPDPD
jgi:hypothetical protein